MIVHLRFGYPPYLGKSKNYDDGSLLAGVSVMQGIKSGEEYQIVLPPFPKDEDKLSAMLYDIRSLVYRPCWLVHGKVCGTGPIGEDLLEDPVFMHRVQVAGITSACDNQAAFLPQERGAEFTDVMLPIYTNITEILTKMGVGDTDWAPHKLLDLLVAVRSNPDHCRFQQLWAMRYAIQSAFGRMRKVRVTSSTTHAYFSTSYTFDKFCHAYGLL